MESAEKLLKKMFSLFHSSIIESNIEKPKKHGIIQYMGGDYFDNWENNINEPLNEPLNLVLQIIRENKYITYNEIAVKIKKSRSTVLRYIQKLKSTGKIIRHGADKDGYWETVE